MTDWVTSSKYSIDHPGGRWRISASKVNDVWRYTLWDLKKDRRVGTFPTADEAKELTNNEVEKNE